MKKNKFKVLMILSTMFLIPLASCDNSIMRVKVLNNDKKQAWKEEPSAYAAYTFGINNPTDSFTGVVKFQYKNIFSENLSKLHTNLQVSQTNSSLNAYYKLMTYFFGYGGGSESELKTLINDFVVNENKENLIINSNIKTELLYNPFYKINIIQKPYFVYTIWNTSGPIKEQKLTIEDYHALASYEPTEFLNNFFGLSGRAATPFGFLKLQLVNQITITATDATGNLLTGDKFKQYRPQKDNGEVLPLYYSHNITENFYDEKTTQENWNNYNSKTWNLNDSTLTELNRTWTHVLISDVANGMLGLNVERTPSGSDGDTDSIDNISNSQIQRSYWQSHNQLIISHVFNNQAIDDWSSYKEGEYHGYKNGLIVGQEQWDWTNFLKSIFSGIDSFLNVEILPHVKLWYFVGIPLVFGLLKWLLSWFR